jgi:hypothetical protein
MLGPKGQLGHAHHEFESLSGRCHYWLKTMFNLRNFRFTQFPVAHISSIFENYFWPLFWKITDCCFGLMLCLMFDLHLLSDVIEHKNSCG